MYSITVKAADKPMAVLIIQEMITGPFLLVGEIQDRFPLKEFVCLIETDNTETDSELSKWFTHGFFYMPTMDMLRSPYGRPYGTLLSWKRLPFFPPDDTVMAA